MSAQTSKLQVISLQGTAIGVSAHVPVETAACINIDRHLSVAVVSKAVESLRSLSNAPFIFCSMISSMTSFVTDGCCGKSLQRWLVEASK